MSNNKSPARLFSDKIGPALSVAGVMLSAYELFRYLQIELPPREVALGVGTTLLGVLFGAFSVYVAQLVKKLRITPRVFLSYSNVDREVAGQVANALRSAGAYVWFDEEQLKLGQNIQAAIERGIKESNSFVVLIPHGKEPGPFLSFEMEVAQANNIPVIAALTEDSTASPIPGLRHVRLHVGHPNSMKELIRVATNPRATMKSAK